MKENLNNHNKRNNCKSNLAGLRFAWLNIIQVVLTLSIIILSLSFIYADIGCCLDTSSGLCTKNSESESCTLLGGEFFASPNCNSAQCIQGCCILGTKTAYSTSRECEILSRARGFEFSFQASDALTCAGISQQEETGACLSGEYKPFDCSFKKRSACGSEKFYPEISCTSPELNTTCKTTDKTMCYETKLYSKDSCGNPDKLLNACTYASGNICQSAGKDKAICKSLNCIDKWANSRKNGESWCVNYDGEINFKEPEELEGEYSVSVGSRYFLQRCLNGNITTEPCADFRAERCKKANSSSEIKCEINPASECLAANKETLNAKTGKMFDKDKCGEGCYEFRALDCVKNSAGGELCGAARMNRGSNPAFAGNVVEFASDMLKSLNLNLCLPTIPAGLNFWPSVKSSASNENSESICSKGSLTAEIDFWSPGGWGPYDIYLTRQSSDNNDYGYAGIVSDDISVWKFDGDKLQVKQDTGVRIVNPNTLAEEYEKTQLFNELITSNEVTLNQQVISILNNRCRRIGDCDGKLNWVEQKGIESSSSEYNKLTLVKSYSDGKTHKKGTFSFECKPWKSPSGDAKCDECGKDGLPCSEYRCRALGKACEYKEPAGADKGLCTSSSDKTSPKISLKSINPASPIPPYTPATFIINTDEDSMCKFSFDNSGNNYDDMKYDFGGSFGQEHSVILTLPGQTKGISQEDKAYPLIKEGIHSLYIRCIDARENGKFSAPFVINFEVMKTPDKNPPTIISFAPISGSSIKFNTTTKEIKLKISEPSECRWDSENKIFSLMKNSFSCDESITPDNTVKGYFCSGTLTNITLNLNQESQFYIRCKDQPWLVNDSVSINKVDYSRNEMLDSIVYRLKPSERFYISETNPTGSIKVGANNLNITLSAITQGGAFYGKAICYWKLANQSELLSSKSLKKFKTTDSSSSTQIITSPFIGNNFYSIKCEDAIGNEDNKNGSFSLAIDDSASFILRLFESFGKLKIKTDEDSICYYSFDKILNCLFDVSNATTMSGLYSQEHDAVWKDDKTYYIKCIDYYGNLDNGCNKIIRTY